jgi:hypothetical protein
MPKKTKTTEEHLKIIELLVAGVLMNQEKKPSVQQIARLIGVDESVIADLYPQRKSKK